MENNDLIIFAEKVRQLLKDRVPPSLPSTPFNEFPNGCCSDASLILSALLREVKGHYSEVVSWNCGQGGAVDSHAWVEIGGQCIDITLDQFNLPTSTIYSPIYVGPKTDLHMRYASGERADVTEPDWLDAVVDDLKIYNYSK